MTATVAQFHERSLPLDSNGVPVGHYAAERAAVQVLMDLVNELPDSFYRLGLTDATWVTGNVIGAYLRVLKGAE